MYQYITHKNQLKKEKINFLNIKKNLPYLSKKKLNIINLSLKNNILFQFNIHSLNFLIKNFYYTNILEKFSKILINSNKKIKNKNNFNK